ncbi:MAG: hypothetical protein MZU84_04415 [Sphingobacterium sp.]|nr:hypothetical protein [Sphingobacterium sp.]
MDVIATDHAPHHADDKKVEFDRAPFGIVGLETAVSLDARPPGARRRHHAWRGWSSCCRPTRRASSSVPGGRLKARATPPTSRSSRRTWA